MSRGLLLDTHVFLWWRSSPERLSDRARDAITTTDLAAVSTASVWEASIKSALGKLRLKEPFVAGVAASRFVPLVITLEHAERAGQLHPHHADPFDRMLIAQALVEDLSLVTRDQTLEAYGVDLIRA